MEARSPPSLRSKNKWKLYNLADDFTQGHDLAASNPLRMLARDTKYPRLSGVVIDGQSESGKKAILNKSIRCERMSPRERRASWTGTLTKKKVSVQCSVGDSGVMSGDRGNYCGQPTIHADDIK